MSLVLPSRVQGVAVNVAVTAGSLTPALSGVTSGNVLVLMTFDTSRTSGYGSTAVSSTGTTWIHVGSFPAPVGTIDFWVGTGFATTAGALTVTVTLTGSDTAGCQLDEWSGVSSYQPFHWQTPPIGISGTGTTPSATFTTDDAKGIAYVATITANAETASPSGNWTALTGPTTGGVQKCGIAYANQLGIDTAPAWTQGSGNYSIAGMYLRPITGWGESVYNDPAATVNDGDLTPQATPDYLDSVIWGLQGQGTGVQAGNQAEGLAVLPYDNASMKFTVESGWAFINWGVHLCNGIAFSATLANGDVTNPRRDLVYVDNPGGTSSTLAIRYVKGVAAAVPCPPLLPANAVPLAIIDVPVGATVITNSSSTSEAHIIDKRPRIQPPGWTLREYYTKPSVADVETVPRSSGAWLDSGALVSGTAYATAIVLPEGYTVGKLAIKIGSTGATTPTHWWFALADMNLLMLAQTADQLTAACAANSLQSLAIAKTPSGSVTKFTTEYTGLYYLIYCQAAATVAHLTVPNSTAASLTPNSLAPILAGSSTTGLSTPSTFPTTFAALTAVNQFYGYVARV